MKIEQANFNMYNDGCLTRENGNKMIRRSTNHIQRNQFQPDNNYLEIYGGNATHFHANLWLPTPALEVVGTYPVRETIKPLITLTQKRRNIRHWCRKKNRTNGGRHSSACRFNTENPPWVLVSDAVSILQKECTRGRAGRGGKSSSSTNSTSCWQVCIILTAFSYFQLTSEDFKYLSNTRTNHTWVSGSKMTWANTSSVSGSACN